MDDEHIAGPKGQLRFIGWLLGIGTAVALLVYFLMGSTLLLVGVGFGWLVVGIYSIILFKVIEPTGNAIGRVIVSSGNSTPSVDQHSNIETMMVRGEYARAAEAYRAVIASQPGDIVACEKLAQLALREMKDYDTAIMAYREAEKRSLEPRRQLGYAILIAGIVRDNKKDLGKATVELRRILARYPDAPNADRLRAELEELKAMHFEGQ